MKNTVLHIIIIVLVGIVFGACQKQAQPAEGHNSLSHAKYLSLVESDGCVLVTVADPWNEDGTLARYALTESDDVDVPDEYAEIRVPLQRSVVYASVHTAAIEELGAADKVVGVADASYFDATDPFAARIASGQVCDIGSSMSPSLETIINLEPDALLLSPWENGNLGGVERSGVPVIYMADYLEPTPLGRAEWIRFLGLLYGENEKADAIYAKVVNQYNDLKTMASLQSERPRVVTERPYMGVWYVPGGASYMAQMLADAGADYPWADDGSAGSLSLDEAAVLNRGADVRFWLIKDAADHSANSLKAAMPHADAFSAYPDGVYICNTSSTSIFRDIAFHPERLLAEFISIFHPGAIRDYELQYYKPLKK